MAIWKKISTWVPFGGGATPQKGDAPKPPAGEAVKQPLTPQMIENLKREVARYDDILKVKPEDLEIQLKLGETWMKLERYGEALKPFRAILTARPDHASALFHIAECYINTGRDEQALEVLETARKLNPESQALVRMLAQAHTNLCITYGKLRRYEDSTQHFKEALALIPDFGPAHLAMGLNLLQQGRYDDAIKMFLKTIELDPNLLVEAHHHLARAYAKKGQIKKAFKHFNEAIQANPKAAVVHQDLGEFQFKLGKFDEAVTAFENALAMSPRLTADAWFKLGIARVKLNRTRAAEEPLRKALELTPENEQVQNGLTEVLFRIHQLDRKEGHGQASFQLLREAVRINPTHAKAQLALGVLYDQKSDGQKAIRHVLFAKNFFLEQKDKEGLAKAIKLLNALYPKYKLTPEDFEKLIMPSRS